VKLSLGKIMKLLIILIFTWLNAEDFSYKFHINKHNPYMKEAVTLTLDLKQTNHDIVLLFNFDLCKSDDYFFQRIDSKETNTHHDTQIRYVYMLYPLKVGDINISFNLTKKITTDESIAYSFSGDRDNVKGLVTTNTKITLPPLALSIKKLPSNTSLVGDFKLTYKFQKSKAKAYEPIPFKVKIDGSGYPPLIDKFQFKLLKKDVNFTLFNEAPIINSTHSQKGTKSTITYNMALSNNHSFDLPAINIKAFNPKTEKSYVLIVPKQHFSIAKTDINTLLDKIDKPKPLENNWSWLGNLLSYLVVFTAGYFTAISLKWKKRVLPQQDNPFKVKIESCKDERSLLQLLMATDSKKFAKSIELLESSLYRDEKNNFKKIKKDILEKL